MGKHVVIIGAGIVGCATAYFLAREGVEVTVLDAVGVAAGASGRNNGLIEHPYDAATVELYEESVGLLHELLGDAMPAEPVGTLLVAESEADADALVAHHTQFPELETTAVGACGGTGSRAVARRRHLGLPAAHVLSGPAARGDLGVCRAGAEGGREIRRGFRFGGFAL